MQNLIFCQIFSVLLHLLSFRFPFSFFLPFRPFFPSRPFSFFPRLSELPRILFFPAASFFLPPFFRPFPLSTVFLISVFPTPRSFFLPFPSTRFCTSFPNVFSPPAPFRPNITSLNISRNIPMLRFAAQSVVRGRL